MALTPRQQARVELLREHGCKYPQTTVEEAARVGLPLSYALAFLEQESSGKDRDGHRRFGLNLFGSDPVGNPVKGGFVTEQRYQQYLRHRKAGAGMQGVGPCQLTWWEFQDKADRLGGCDKPRFNMRVGFAIAKALIKQHGLMGGVARYNGTGPAAEAYARAWRERQKRWHDLLVAEAPTEATPSRPEPTRPLKVTDPFVKGADVKRLQRALSLRLPAGRRLEEDGEYGPLTDRHARVRAWRLGAQAETLARDELTVGVQRLVLGLQPPNEDQRRRAAGRKDKRPPARFETAAAATGESGVRRRWQSRLRTRKRLLADAQADLRAAKTAAERNAAEKRVELRKAQVTAAQRVLERHAADGGRAPTNVRERVVRAAMLGYKHREAVHYTQGPQRWEGIAKRMRAHRGQFPTQADCSSYATWVIWDALGGPKAGADIVNGANWNGGYTGTQIGRGKEVALSQAQPGDLVFYGPSKKDINHVAIVVAPGRVISHGSEGGPYLIDIHYRRDLQQVRSYLPR